jgi:alkanesulfonate monooxygenase SsuD/methylene tetrahydromethanopterin reductase-like flavin-dependent oxidoreductase (luciferase family)
MGWDELVNGDLIKAAESAGFDVMVTGDQNLVYQQNLTSRRVALVVLLANNWPTVKTNLAGIIDAVERAKLGSYQSVAFDRPALLRRPPPARFTP